MPRFAQVERKFKQDGSIVTLADTAMQNRVQDELRHNWPDIALLGEEMAIEQQQAVLKESNNGVWLLDPLDGTSNFASGIPYFCVSLALLIDDCIRLGLIYDPIRDECFSAVEGEGASLNGKPLSVPESLPELERSMALVDFKRLQPGLGARLGEAPPYASQRSFGSGALDWCMIATGRCQAYLHGGQKLWDYAAGQLILSEAGGYASTLSGETVLTTTLTPRSVVAAPNSELFERWFKWLSEQCAGLPPA